MSHESMTAPDLMGLVNRAISPDMIARTAQRLGENRERTQAALSASVPSVLTALSDVASSAAGATHLKHVIDDSKRESRSPEALLGAADHDHGAAVFDQEIGDKAAGLTGTIARTSGVKPESAHQLLGGVTSIALMALRQNASAMGPDSLQTMFHDQRPGWIRKMPAPLASLFSGRPAPAVEQSHPVVDTRVVDEKRAVRGPAIREVDAGRRRAWMVPAILLAALVLLGIPLLRGLRHRSSVAPVASRPVAQEVLPGVEIVSLRLPNGETLAVPRGSAAHGLALFMAGTAATPQRFTLSPFNFEFGSTKLTPASMSTVNDVAKVLRAYPKATILVESHTDAVGTPESNMTLSLARSEAVKSLLMSRTVEPARIETAGRGQQNPISDNNTEAGRAKNRRTDIVVTGR